MLKISVGFQEKEVVELEFTKQQGLFSATLLNAISKLGEELTILHRRLSLKMEKLNLKYLSLIWVRKCTKIKRYGQVIILIIVF